MCLDLWALYSGMLHCKVWTVRVEEGYVGMRYLEVPGAGFGYIALEDMKGSYTREVCKYALRAAGRIPAYPSRVGMGLRKRNM